MRATLRRLYHDLIAFLAGTGGLRHGQADQAQCLRHEHRRAHRPRLLAHPRDQSRNYRDLDYWVELAGILERGKFDGLFLADTLGMVDGLESDPGITLREAVQAPMNDPLLLVSAMAHATRHLGFGVTANLSTPIPMCSRAACPRWTI